MKMLKKVLLTVFALGLTISLPAGAMEENPFTPERQNRSGLDLTPMQGTTSGVIGDIISLSRDVVLEELNILNALERQIAQVLPAQQENQNNLQIVPVVTTAFDRVIGNRQAEKIVMDFEFSPALKTYLANQNFVNTLENRIKALVVYQNALQAQIQFLPESTSTIEEVDSDSDNDCGGSDSSQLFPMADDTVMTEVQPVAASSSSSSSSSFERAKELFNSGVKNVRTGFNTVRENVRTGFNTVRENVRRGLKRQRTEATQGTKRTKRTIPQVETCNLFDSDGSRVIKITDVDGAVETNKIEKLNVRFDQTEKCFQLRSWQKDYMIHIVRFPLKLATQHVSDDVLKNVIKPIILNIVQDGVEFLNPDPGAADKDKVLAKFSYKQLEQAGIFTRLSNLKNTIFQIGAEVTNYLNLPVGVYLGTSILVSNMVKGSLVRNVVVSTGTVGIAYLLLEPVVAQAYNRFFIPIQNADQKK